MVLVGVPGKPSYCQDIGSLLWLLTTRPNIRLHFASIEKLKNFLGHHYG
jgi:hypothetical protein